ncbi:MAG: hypothetical protein GY793_12175 [Proteobacteria bacterium]|nr:hypothetical protein [Pseudomonadota bacterium]
MQRLLEYKLSKMKIELSTHEIITGLESFILDEVDYKTDKLYMISDKLSKSKINKEVFKFEKKVILSNDLSNLTKKM